MKKFFQKNKVAILSIILSLVAILISIQANNLSESANKISTESKNISRDGLDYNKDVRSQQIVSLAYDNIYDNEENRQNMSLIRANIGIVNSDDVLKIVDSLEEAGASYCQGTAWIKHIKNYLKNTLSYVCVDNQIYTLYAGKKNGLAILCDKFFPASLFASSLGKKNLYTCNFH